MSSKSINASIAGQEYSFTVAEKDEASLLQAVKVVDAEMSRIRTTSQLRNQEHIAVMTAIRFAADLLTLRNTYISQPDTQITNQLTEWNEHIERILRDYEQI